MTDIRHRQYDMHRRAFLAGTGALLASRPSLSFARKAPIIGNPIANPKQVEAEAFVRRLWTSNIIQRARETVSSNFAIAHGSQVPDEARSGFDVAIDAFVTNYLFKAAAFDPHHPKVVRLFMPPYSWFGHDVPDARMGGDNPDNIYRVAGVGHGPRYRVTGRAVGTHAPSISLTLVSNWGTSETIQTMMFDDVKRDPDGQFIITIDDKPADGRPNHLTTRPGVRFLFVRDSLSDWGAQTPLALDIECLDQGDAWTETELAKETAARVVEEVPLYFWFSRMFSALSPNEVKQPDGRPSFGGLVRQTSGRALLDIPEGKGFLVTFDPAGAAYSALALHNWWFQSIDAHKIQSSLTADMAERNPDGTVTCIISPENPGTSNWIDTGGFRNVQMLCRWQGYKDIPTIRGEMVSLDRVGQLLPPISSFTQEERLQERRTAFARRWLEQSLTSGD